MDKTHEEIKKQMQTGEWLREAARTSQTNSQRRQKRNRAARERYQVMRDLGMKKTPYGWE